MKQKTVTVVAVLLMLCGCAAQPEPVPEPSETVPIPVTAPIERYDHASTIEKETDGTIKAYPLALSDAVGFLPIGDDILLFSGASETTLTRFSGETLQLTAALTLACEITPEDPSVQIHSNGITYYDSLHRDLVFLDHRLRETQRIPLPEAMCGVPALSADLKNLYYCTSDALRVRDLETNHDRLLKQMQFCSQTLSALHCDDRVVSCDIVDESNISRTLFISAGTGILLYDAPPELQLQTRNDFYFARHMDGIYPELLIGDSEQGPTLLSPDTYDCSAFPLLSLGGAVLATPDSSTDCTHLDYYDLHSGRRTASIPLSGESEIRSMRAAGSSYVWFLRFDPQYGCDTLYRWEFGKNAANDNRSYFSARYSFDQPDLDGLAYCREIADYLSREYGVQILLWTDATVFEPWDYSLVPEYQVPVIRSNLIELERFLAQYPKDFFLKAAEKTGSGRIQICLVRSILGKDTVSGTLSEAVGLQYWDQNANSYLCLSVQQDSLFQNACHEMSHIIDSRVLTVCKVYDDWSSLNPSGFQYDYTPTPARSADDRKWTVGANRAFIDLYSMTYPKEDRARIMEYAMMEGFQRCFETEIMQSKLRKLCLGIRQAFDLKDWTAPLPWEQYLNQPLYPK